MLDTFTQKANNYLAAYDVEIEGEADDESRQLLDQTIRAGCFEAWAYCFGQDFVDIMAPHHREAVLWHWESRMAFIEGRLPDYWAYFPIWPRGHMKSTIARRIAVMDALISYWANVPAYILYVSRNKDMVGKHGKSIETLVASRQIKAICPKLSIPKKSEAGASKGYTAGLLNTQAGVFHFAGLEEGLAGGNVDDVRPTTIILDDIDGREKSEVITQSRFDKLTNEILPMRQSNTLVFFAQNLINRFSVMYRIHSGQARVLTSRKPTKPIPSLINPVYGEKTVDGITKDIVVSGTPTWAAYGIDRCNEELATGGGLEAFKRENQHEVHQTQEGLVHKKYDDRIHAISYSQFAAVYGSKDAWKNFYKVAFSDWARTKTKYHANVAGFMAVSSQNSPVPNVTFVIPLSFPEATTPEDVAVRLLSVLTPHAYYRTGASGEQLPVSWQELVDDAWKRTNAHEHFATVSDRLKFATGYYKTLIPKYSRKVLRAYNVGAAVNSHSEDIVRKMFNDGFGFDFVPANPAHHDALEDIDEAMRVDYELPHLFKPDETGYSRFAVLCEDDTSQIPEIIGGIEVYPPQRFPESLDGADLHDSDLFRFQMANRRFADVKLLESGESPEKLVKLHDDFGQSLQFVYLKKLLTNIPFTAEEKQELSLSPKVRQATIDEMPDSTEKDMTLQRRKFELEALHKQDKAKQKGFHVSRYARR